jgi:hypothetical protein
MARLSYDSDLLQAALRGYEHQKKQVEAQIADIRRRLGGRRVAATVLEVYQAPPRRRQEHRISPEGRQRIAEAQRRRWAQAKAAGRPGRTFKKARASTAAGE